jgi:hypothetical protein
MEALLRSSIFRNSIGALPDEIEGELKRIKSFWSS